MPTGYTQPVADGKITSLRRYAMLCARAFGATIDMRDEPTDAEIPDKFEAGSYHRRQLVDARAALARLMRMSPSEAQRAAQQSHAVDFARWRERTVEDAQQRARYLAMIEQVDAWSTPTPGHAKLKDFMLSQLRESIKFDSSGEYLPMPRIQRWPEWVADRIAKAKRDIAYHAKGQLDDNRRAADRTAWVRDLRESLPQ